MVGSTLLPEASPIQTRLGVCYAEVDLALGVASEAGTVCNRAY